jgi:hypothetical protein
MKFILVCFGGLVMALLGAPPAAADINISGINIGNQGNANASFGNVAVALGPLDTAEATGGIGNIALASGGSVATKRGGGSFNVVTAAGNSNAGVVDSNLTWTSTLNQGSATVINANGTFSAAVGKNTIKPSSTSIIDQNLSVQTAFCGGTATSAQGRINVSFGSPCRGS